MKTRSLLLFLIAMLTAISVTAQSKMRIIEKSGSKTVVELNDVESINLFQEPWSNWQEAGTASYTYSIYWNGTLGGANVNYREYLLNNNEAQFQLSGMAGGYDLTIEYDKETGNCRVLEQQVADNSNYGPVFVSDCPHYPGQPGLSYDDYPCTYNAETGTFTLNLVYFVDPNNGSNYTQIAMFGNGVETIQMDGFYAPDYSLTMEYAGKHTNENYEECAMINVTMGTDLTSCALAVVAADEDTDATVAGMLDGSIDCLTLTESTSVTIPLAKSGTYNAVAITYDDYDNMLDVHTMEFEFTVGNGDDNWISLGMATYTEDCVTTFFNVENVSYQVEVRENTNQPGLYRIINPYGAAYPYNAEGDYDTSKEYFIEIDATDPEGVYIPGIYGTGMNWGYGEFSITSMAYYYMAAQGATFEEVKDGGYCGILADNVITFPAKSLLISLSEYNGGNFYTSNNNGAFRLDMNDMTPAGAAPAKAAAARISAKRELDINADIQQAVMPRITLKINPAMEFETPSMHKSTMKKVQSTREMFRTDAVIGIKDGGVAKIKRVNENEEAIIDK